MEEQTSCTCCEHNSPTPLEKCILCNSKSCRFCLLRCYCSVFLEKDVEISIVQKVCVACRAKWLPTKLVCVECQEECNTLGPTGHCIECQNDPRPYYPRPKESDDEADE